MYKFTAKEAKEFSSRKTVYDSNHIVDIYGKVRERAYLGGTTISFDYITPNCYHKLQSDGFKVEYLTLKFEGGTTRNSRTEYRVSW